MHTQLIATAALIDDAGRVLICKRHPDLHEGGKWEFPGGKVDAGESPIFALQRELKEEIGLTVQQSCIAPLSFNASMLDDQTELLILLYVIRTFDGQPQPMLQQEMQWVTPPRLADFPMPAANQHLIAMLRDVL